MKKNSKVSQVANKQKFSGGDRVHDYTNATQQTRFELPFFAIDEKGAHTVKNAITRVIFAPDSIRQQNLPKGMIRRGATQVKYLVPCQDVDGKIDAILDRWLSPLWYKNSIERDLMADVIASSMKQKFPLDITGNSLGYDLATFICVAFAIKAFADKEDFSYSFVVQDPCDRFHEDHDLGRLDAELRSRLAAVAFFRMNDAALFNEKDLNKADRIIIGTFTNRFFTVPSTWDRFSTIGDAIGGKFVHTISEYRSIVLTAEAFIRENDESTNDSANDTVDQESTNEPISEGESLVAESDPMVSVVAEGEEGSDED